MRLGLVSEVVPASGLAARSLAIAQAIARGPREVLLRTKAKIIGRTAINAYRMRWFADDMTTNNVSKT